MKQLDFVDQTIRDAQQSLWGFRMSTEMLAPILPVMDQVGYKAISTVGARGVIVTMRAFNEDPFARMRLLSEKLRQTPLRGSFWAWNLQGWDVEPMAAIELWIKRQVAYGIKSFWMCDYQNLMDRLAYLAGVARAEGAEVVPGLLYANSPVHTDELFARKVRKLVEMGGIAAIHVEDASGVLTVERIRTLLPAIQRESKGIPLEMHAHCTIGLAPISYMEAIKLGVTTLHTAVAPLANSTSLPPIETTIDNARRLGYTTNLDQEALKAVSDHFRKVALENNLPMGAPSEYNLFQFEHQLPGGMMGTLRNQLAELKQEHRLEELLEEIILVRRELGYPVMATPYSQIVGAQALFNITSGERYKIVSDEVIKYMLGFYGEPDGPVDQEVKEKILGSAKAKKWLKWKIPEITVDDLRREIGPGLSDDELLLQLLNPRGEVKTKLNTLYYGKS
jgi:oxaloacetate decarboxylase alpha subunit